MEYNPVGTPHWVQTHPPTVYPLQSVNYTSIWELEKSYSSHYWLNWFKHNWQLSVYISITYLIVIFGVQEWMRGRARFTLRRPLFVWNLLLALFSILGALRTTPELVHILLNRGGWWGGVCSRNDHHQGTAFWGLLFTLSKAVELGDTLFIVLRKQPLIFLHWYHHITVLFYTWYTYSSYDSTSRWFMVMNYIVHSLMYSYYAGKSLSLRIPRQLAMVITTLQLTQMVFGLGLNLYSLHNNDTCQVQPKHIHLALGMYATYFALFANFFWRAYHGNRKSGDKIVEGEKKE